MSTGATGGAPAAGGSQGLGWFGIVRLGLVQTSLGAIVVLTTSLLNRVMVVELALAAMVPGALVGFHYAVEILRPRWGHGSDQAGRRTPWIIGGMIVLAAGGVAAAAATALMAQMFWAGLALAVAAYGLIGIGAGAAGTSLLVLLATHTAPGRRAAAASIVWIMMIAGFAVTTAVVGQLIDPFSFARLITISACVGGIAILLTLAVVHGIESRGPVTAQSEETPSLSDMALGEGLGQAENIPTALGTTRSTASFRTALAQVWGEKEARRFTIFVFVSMLAYSAQDLILEPFAGLVFGMTPGESTRLSSLEKGGVLIGMLLIALAGSGFKGRRLGSLRFWTVAGCLASAAALASLAISGHAGPGWPLAPSVMALGFANGVFAVAAIGSMMNLANEGRQGRAGVRMGLWGAAQAIAFGLGGFIGTFAVDVMRAIMGTPIAAYGTVFATEALLFTVAAFLALKIRPPAPGSVDRPSSPMPVADKAFMAGAAGR